MEDLQIIELYWKRDPQAIVCSEEKYGNYCYTIANHILGSHEDSKECVNDTWLHTWNRIPPHRPNIFRMFLAKITRGLACNRFKKDHTQKRGSGQLMLALEELSECLSDETAIEDVLIAEELGKSICQL